MIEARSCPRPSYLTKIDTAMVAAELEEARYLEFVDDRGRSSVLFEYGKEAGEAIVLLPPYGMTFLLVARLGRILGSRFRVLIWESSGSPNSSVAMVDSDLSLPAQARHFATVVEGRGLTSFHFVGWCQAAQLAAYATAEGYIAPQTMTWIAPGGFGYSLVPSEFDRCALPVYLEIEQNSVAYATKLGRILDKYGGRPVPDQDVGESLTMLHLSDAQTTHGFSRYMKAFEDNKAPARRALPEAVASTPTLVLHCRDDRYSHYSESVQIGKRNPSVEVRLAERGGHLQVFDEPASVAEAVFGFLESARKS